MAFLDNSGDIILDAVLTDTGRMRLAKGDGSFKIVKFALGDDEINYWSYENVNNAAGRNTSGSAFYDLSILQTPVLEAFTNNTSLLKHRLVSYTRNDLLYLPIIKNNTGDDASSALFQDSSQGNIYVVGVDQSTLDTSGIKPTTAGVLNGLKGGGSNYIRLDFGFDTTKLAKESTIRTDVKETQLIVEFDNRLGTLVDALSGEELDFDFLDDDQVATYVLTGPIISTQGAGEATDSSALAGPFTGQARFQFKASISLQTSDALYNQFGTTGATLNAGNPAGTYNFIDTLLRVTGGNTGYSVDVPVRFVRKVT